MAAPVGAHVGELVKAMWNAMIDLLFIRIRLGIGLADALGDDAGIAFGVAGITTILALHAGRVLEEFTAQGTTHDVVELLGDKLVTKHLVDLFLSLANGAFAIESGVEHAFVLGLFREADRQVDGTGWFQGEPCTDWLRGNDGSSQRGVVHGLPGSRVGWRTAKLRCVGAHVELRGRTMVATLATHSIGRYPARAVDLGLDPFATHLLDNIRDADPEETDRQWVVSRFIIDRQLDLVGLVDINIMVLGFPLVGAGGFGAGHDIVFDLDRDVGFGAARKLARGGMIDVLDSLDANGEISGQRFAHIGCVDAVV